MCEAWSPAFPALLPNQSFTIIDVTDLKGKRSPWKPFQHAKSPCLFVTKSFTPIMPDVIVRNETPDKLNVAFRFVAPASWKNSLLPGDTWTTHLGSTPFTVEVRLDRESNQYSPQDSWATAGDVTGGWFAGAASVLGGVFGGSVGRAAALPLMNHAIQGKSISCSPCSGHRTVSPAGGRFARDAEGVVVSVGGVWIPFYNKTYAVRFDESSGYSLWDVDENRRL